MKKMMITFFIACLLLAKAQEVDIKADHFYADDITKVAYFEGNAVIQQGENFFRAEKVVVHFNKKRKATKYEAVGDVSFDLVEQGIHYEGRAGKIIYAPNDSKYYFEGDVYLNDLTNNRRISAERIELDLKTGLADIQGGPQRPVHFIFEIEDRQ